MASKFKSNIPNYSNLFQTAMQKSIREIGFAVEAEAKRTAPIGETGDYMGNIIYDGVKTITANMNYSAAIEYGIRKPVIIRPKNKNGVLAFMWKGKMMFFKSVKQKPRAPRPVMRNAARKVQKQVKSIFLRNFG